MSDTAASKEMLNRSISAFSDDGRMSVAELDHIVEAASTDGVMDPAEKAVATGHNNAFACQFHSRGPAAFVLY